MGDRRISSKLKGKMLSLCITSAYIFMNELEMTALTEKQQEMVQVYDNSVVRRIVGAKRVDKRTMEEVRVGA